MSSNQPIKDVHVIIEQEAPPTEDMPPTGASLDLSKPIEVTNETIVIIDGKKCVLSANPDTGQLCAYPVLTQEGKCGRQGIGGVPLFCLLYEVGIRTSGYKNYSVIQT